MFGIFGSKKSTSSTSSIKSYATLDTANPNVMVAAYGRDGLKKAAAMYPNDKKIQSAYNGMKRVESLMSEQPQSSKKHEYTAKDIHSFDSFEKMMNDPDSVLIFK